MTKYLGKLLLSFRYPKLVMSYLNVDELDDGDVSLLRLPFRRLEEVRNVLALLSLPVSICIV